MLSRSGRSEAPRTRLLAGQTSGVALLVTLPAAGSYPMTGSVGAPSEGDTLSNNSATTAVTVT